MINVWYQWIFIMQNKIITCRDGNSNTNSILNLSIDDVNIMICLLSSTNATVLGMWNLVATWQQIALKENRTAPSGFGSTYAANDHLLQQYCIILFNALSAVSRIILKCGDDCCN